MSLWGKRLHANSCTQTHRHPCVTSTLHVFSATYTACRSLPAILKDCFLSCAPFFWSRGRFLKLVYFLISLIIKIMKNISLKHVIEKYGSIRTPPCSLMVNISCCFHSLAHPDFSQKLSREVQMKPWENKTLKLMQLTWKSLYMSRIFVHVWKEPLRSKHLWLL